MSCFLLKVSVTVNSVCSSHTYGNVCCIDNDIVIFLILIFKKFSFDYYPKLALHIFFCEFTGVLSYWKIEFRQFCLPHKYQCWNSLCSYVYFIQG